MRVPAQSDRDRIPAGSSKGGWFVVKLEVEDTRRTTEALEWKGSRIETCCYLGASPAAKNVKVKGNESERQVY